MYYWQKTGKPDSQIDFLIQKSMDIIPVAVRPGTPGSLKSLHSFMAARGLKKAVRLDLNPPSVQEVNVKTTTGQHVSYILHSYPIYMAELIV